MPPVRVSPFRVSSLQVCGRRPGPSGSLLLEQTVSERQPEARLGVVSRIRVAARLAPPRRCETTVTNLDGLGCRLRIETGPGPRALE